MNQRYDLFAFSLLVGAAALFVLATIFGSEVSGIYSFLRDWQTLIAGTFAIFAAIIAAYPVRKQLSRMNIQSSIMARQVLVQRLSAIEKRRARSKASLSSVTSEFLRDIYFEDQWSDDPEPDVNPHWAHDASLRVSQTINALSADQLSKTDSHEIESIRRDVLRLARELEDCLGAIHAPDSMFLDEYELSVEDLMEIERKSDTAKDELPAKISLLQDMASALDKAFNMEIDKLRIKIRDVDRLIVDDQVGAA